MDLDAKPLRCFAAVAEEQSFSRAAQRLHVSQPALSAQIRELERLLGFTLFERSTRRVALSPQGRVLLDHAYGVIEASERFKRTAATLHRADASRLLLGAAFYTIDIPERIRLLEGFIEARADITLSIDTRWQQEMLQDLDLGQLDLVFMIGVPVRRRDWTEALAHGPGAEILYPDDLRRLVLRTEPVALLVPEEAALASAIDPLPASALAGQQVAMLAPAHGAALVEPIRRFLTQAGAIPVVPPESHGIGVERYGGQFRIPAITLGWFRESRGREAGMVRRALAGLELSTEIVVVGNPDLASPAAEAFWRFADALSATAHAG